jgi:hypothetical protein
MDFTDVVPAKRRDPYAAAFRLKDAVQRLSRNPAAGGYWRFACQAPFAKIF